MEDYKKMYEDLLERIKQMANAQPEVTKAAIKSQFPELKESEDEGIWIINYLNNRILNSTIIAEKENLKKAIAWLEKQGEQKPAIIIPKFRIGDYVKNVNDKREPIYEIVYMDKECYVCEYRGKENMGDKAVMHFAFDYPYLRHIQKTACSEEDEVLLKLSLDNLAELKDRFGEEYGRVGGCINWLKSLKDRVQPKQEWSKEDKKIIIELIGIFESAIDGGHVSFPYRLIKDYIRVLKSCLHQTTWKPSDEQLKALKEAVDEHFDIDGGALWHLYEDLKKLKE